MPSEAYNFGCIFVCLWSGKREFRSVVELPHLGESLKGGLVECKKRQSSAEKTVHTLKEELFFTPAYTFSRPKKEK